MYRFCIICFVIVKVCIKYRTCILHACMMYYTILCTCIYHFELCIYLYVVQRCAIVRVLDAHHQEMDVLSLTSDLKGMGLVSSEQSQKLASLDDEERKHEALLYIMLANHDATDTYHKLVKCLGRRYAFIAADLQGVQVK